ncbi:MAG: hypothetical protein PWQ41_1615 [Bacillota bacterium]|nr:hypothetical protein [Bacillota bacterium]MDK2925841.1 hypothetical protein [Bacillota bacterium]
MERSRLVALLREQVVPAFGCTEPVACALAVARAREALGGAVERIHVLTSPGVYKNGLGVGIPGTGARGIPIAAVLGALIGEPERGLEVLAGVTPEAVQAAQAMVASGAVAVSYDPGEEGVYVEARVSGAAGTARAVIRGTHTNIVYAEKNGRPLLTASGAAGTTPRSSASAAELAQLSLADLVGFAEEVPLGEVEFLLEGVRLNRAAAEAGLKVGAGLALGRALAQLVEEGKCPDGPIVRAKILTAAAADARMGGLPIPVMSSAGSGNHGITATLPVAVMAEHLGAGTEKLARALALSHLVTLYVKEFTGRLSPICGCAVAAGAGAAAAVAWLLGGGAEAVGAAVQNLIADLAGMLCDGGKNGCALKLSTAAAEAILAAELAVAGISADWYDGIVGRSPEETIRNLGFVSAYGLARADEAILAVLTAGAGRKP